MRHNPRLAAAILALALVGCRPPAASQAPTATSVPTVIREPSSAPGETTVREIDCRETAQQFYAKFPTDYDSLEDAVARCKECNAERGVLTMSYDVGPFCNPLTSDGRRSCTDSGQCEGVCLSENEGSESGECSETEQVIGCVFEVADGEALEICFD